MGLNLINQRFNESKIENIPVFFSNLRQVKYLQAYQRDIRSLWLHSWLIAICLCEIDWLGRWRPRCAERHARAHKHHFALSCSSVSNCCGAIFSSTIYNYYKSEGRDHVVYRERFCACNIIESNILHVEKN